MNNFEELILSDIWNYIKDYLTIFDIYSIKLSSFRLYKSLKNNGYRIYWKKWWNFVIKEKQYNMIHFLENFNHKYKPNYLEKIQISCYEKNYFILKNIINQKNIITLELLPWFISLYNHIDIIKIHCCGNFNEKEFICNENKSKKLFDKSKCFEWNNFDSFISNKRLIYKNPKYINIALEFNQGELALKLLKENFYINENTQNLIVTKIKNNDLINRFVLYLINNDYLIDTNIFTYYIYKNDIKKLNEIYDQWILFNVTESYKPLESFINKSIKCNNKEAFLFLYKKGFYYKDHSIAYAFKHPLNLLFLNELSYYGMKITPYCYYHAAKSSQWDNLLFLRYSLGYWSFEALVGSIIIGNLNLLKKIEMEWLKEKDSNNIWNYIVFIYSLVSRNDDVFYYVVNQCLKNNIEFSNNIFWYQKVLIQNYENRIKYLYKLKIPLHENFISLSLKYQKTNLFIFLIERIKLTDSMVKDLLKEAIKRESIEELFSILKKYNFEDSFINNCINETNLDIIKETLISFLKIK
jgi:hypothetical protein